MSSRSPVADSSMLICWQEFSNSKKSSLGDSRSVQLNLNIYGYKSNCKKAVLWVFCNHSLSVCLVAGFDLIFKRIQLFSVSCPSLFKFLDLLLRLVYVDLYFFLMIFFSHSTNVFLILFFWVNLFSIHDHHRCITVKRFRDDFRSHERNEDTKRFFFKFNGIKFLIWVRFQLKVDSCVRVAGGCTRPEDDQKNDFQPASQCFDLQKCFRFQLFVVFCEVFQRWDNNFFFVFKRRWNFSFLFGDAHLEVRAKRKLFSDQKKIAELIEKLFKFFIDTIGRKLTC